MVATDSAFLSVGFSLNARLPANCSSNRACLMAFEQGGNLPACPTFAVYAIRTASSLSLNHVKKGLVTRQEDWRWSSYNNFALDKATVAACPIQIDYVRLPLGYRA